MINNRRWVEYSDHMLGIGIGGDRIPPMWHGWLHNVYDDVPSEDRYFVKSTYFKEHTPDLSGTPLHYKAPGAPSNPDRMEFIEYHRERRKTPW